MFSYYFPPQYSGAAKQAISLAKQLRYRGHHIEFVTVRWPGLDEQDWYEGFPVYRLEAGKGAKHRELKLWWNLLKFVYYRRKNFDILHSHGAYYANSIVGPLSKLAGWKSIVKASLSENDIHGLKSSVSGWLHYGFLRMVDAYIAVSRDMEREFIQSKLALNKVYYMPNAVDTERFYPVSQEEKKRLRRHLGLPENKVVSLTVGVFDSRKNIGWLMQHADDIELYFRAADFFILPSHSEGMPNVVLEAMASGIPCIATKVSGIQELIQDGKNGYTFSPGDSKTLGDAVQNTLNDKEGSMGYYARKTIEESFSISALAKQYEELYQRLTNI